MKEKNETGFEFEGAQPYVNRVEVLDICRREQVWVGDITYVRLKGYFVYVGLRIGRTQHDILYLTQVATFYRHSTPTGCNYLYKPLSIDIAPLRGGEVAEKLH